MKKLTLILLSVLMIVTLAACGDKCEHTYDNACDATCNDCGETREVSAHQWKDATCTTLKTCTVCGTTEGEMLPHNWEDATCITAKTCKTCGTTEGEPLGHKPAEDDGDCGTDVLCTVCGAVTTPARLEHIAHADDGDCTTPITCTECGWLMKPAQEHNFNGDWKTDADGHWQMCQNIDCKVAGTKEAHNKGSDGKCTVCGYYTVDMAGVDIGSVEYDENQSNNDRLDAYKSYQYKQEILSLVARILITIAIEMGIALLFGFRGKKALLLLVVVNTVTQIILNVLLNIINFRSGSWAFVAWYIMLELAIFAIEAAIYTAFMKNLTGKEKPVWFYGAYSLVANGISFGAGLIIANILPGIF